MYYKWLQVHGVLGHVHSVAPMCMLHEAIGMWVYPDKKDVVGLKAPRDVGV